MEGQRKYIKKMNEQSRVLGIWIDVWEEVTRAQRIFPWWPEDVAHGAAIVVEEAGEILKDANSIRWTQKGVTPKELRIELIQTMAMCMRMLLESPVFDEPTEG